MRGWNRSDVWPAPSRTLTWIPVSRKLGNLSFSRDGAAVGAPWSFSGVNLSSTSPLMLVHFPKRRMASQLNWLFLNHANHFQATRFGMPSFTWRLRLELMNVNSNSRLSASHLWPLTLKGFPWPLRSETLMPLVSLHTRGNSGCWLAELQKRREELRRLGFVQEGLLSLPAAPLLAWIRL